MLSAIEKRVIKESFRLKSRQLNFLSSVDNLSALSKSKAFYDYTELQKSHYNALKGLVIDRMVQYDASDLLNEGYGSIMGALFSFVPEKVN